MKEWAFVTNHGLVLSYVAEHNRITSREIASALGITERRVQRIIADLEQAGYVAKTRSGRQNIYVVNTDLSMRHPTQRDRAVKELLAMLKPALKKKPLTSEMPRLIPDTATGSPSEQPRRAFAPAASSPTKQDEGSFVPEPRPAP
jgi:predicted DNA-binding transcriptional regulator YafY